MPQRPSPLAPAVRLEARQRINHHHTRPLATMSAKDLDISKRFANDIKDHELTIVQDSKLYKHIRLTRPGTIVMWFELVTWPGHLCYTGDMGSYVFSRVRDMFAFFRQEKPNPSYWKQEVLASDVDGITEYSPDVFKAMIKEYFENQTTEWDDASKAALWLAIQNEVFPVAEYETFARKATEEFTHDAKESIHGRFCFQDFGEYDFSTFTFRFKWCCHAIPWAIDKYDKFKELQQQATIGAPPA